MGEFEVVVAGLLVAIVVLAALARVLAIPYPIILVVGGGLLGFVPGLPVVRLEPGVVLLVFLPPLLYSAAFQANLNELRAGLRTLVMTSVGLVLVTMLAVAVVAHALLPTMPWSAALALGAIVSPTDPLAAGLIMRRLGVPRRLVSNVEGEGLFNDATALIAFRASVAVVLGAVVTPGVLVARFFAAGAGGVVIGLVVGWLLTCVRRRTADLQINVTMSLLSGYAAYVPAEGVGASGVLAAVTTGLVVSSAGPRVIAARTRLQTEMVWDLLSVLINAVLFVLVGLQLSRVIQALGDRPLGLLLGSAAAVSAAVVGTRMAWCFTVPYLIRAVDRRPSQRRRRVGAASRFVVGWSGMRGSVSLATALSLPLSTRAGIPFPERDLIVFLAFSVIAVTLVAQGLTLPGVIRLVRLGSGSAEQQEEVVARLAATKAALTEIDSLATQEWTREDTVERLRAAYQYRLRRFAARAGKIDDTEGYEDRSTAYQHMVLRILGAQRNELESLRNQGKISNEAMRTVIRDLDLEEARLEL